MQNHAPPRRILILEQDRALAGFIAEVLRDAAAEVVLSSGDEFAPALLAEQWDAVVLDGGYVAQGRREAVALRAGVIVVTSAFDLHPRERASRLRGCVVWLLKPFGPDELLAAVSPVAATGAERASAR